MGCKRGDRYRGIRSPGLTGDLRKSHNVAGVGDESSVSPGGGGPVSTLTQSALGTWSPLSFLFSLRALGGLGNGVRG